MSHKVTKNNEMEHLLGALQELWYDFSRELYDKVVEWSIMYVQATAQDPAFYLESHFDDSNLQIHTNL